MLSKMLKLQATMSGRWHLLDQGSDDHKAKINMKAEDSNLEELGRHFSF